MNKISKPRRTRQVETRVTERARVTLAWVRALVLRELGAPESARIYREDNYDETDVLPADSDRELVVEWREKDTLGSEFEVER